MMIHPALWIECFCRSSAVGMIGENRCPLFDDANLLESLMMPERLAGEIGGRMWIGAKSRLESRPSLSM